MSLTQILIFVIVLLCFLLLTCAYYLIKFGLLLLKLEDVIEESIDDLERREQVMSEILNKEIFFDSIEVRTCISEIKKSRTTINNIALRLTSIGNNNFNPGDDKDAKGDWEEESIQNT